MLIEFNIENFLSFKDLTTLSMVAAKSFKEHSNTNIIETGSNLNLLKSAVVYGNNASGKSNLLEAMGFMKQTVLNSFRDALIENSERKFPLEKFALNTKSEKDTSFFEISFIQKETKYRYGFEIDYDKIVAEWLFHTTSKEVYLLKRDQQKIEVNRSAFKEGLGKEEDVKENVLFLSLLATLGKETSTNIVDWFKKFNFVNGIHDGGHKRYTIDKLKSDKQFFNWVLHFVKYLEIANLSTTVLGNANSFSKVYFPKIIIPISTILVCLVDFFISLSLLVVLFIISGQSLHWQLVLAPILVALTILNGFGIGLYFATINVKYRDVKFIVPVIIQFGMYLSPVIFSTNYYLDRLPSYLHWFFCLNPMVGAIDGFKYCLFGRDMIYNLPYFIVSIVVSFLFLIIGLKYFYKFERSFVDYIYGMSKNTIIKVESLSKK